MMPPDTPIGSVRKKDLDTVYVFGSEEELISINYEVKGFRLPSEAEWEFSAGGGNKGRITGKKRWIFAGSDSLEQVGWFEVSRTQPVGQKKPNELGLYDMSGNVWEWCQDWYKAYPAGPLKDPKGPGIRSEPRVARWVLGQLRVPLSRVQSQRRRPVLAASATSMAFVLPGRFGTPLNPPERGEKGRGVGERGELVFGFFTFLVFEE